MSNRDIILGGAQFGYSYGKFVPSAISSSQEIDELLTCALKNGCSTLDIAQVYEGCVERLSVSEIVNKFKISNKIIYDLNSEDLIRKDLDLTLTKLHKDMYESIAIHNWSDLAQESRVKAVAFLNSLKSQKYTLKTGISVYDKSEVSFSELHTSIDQVQAPLNYFKREFLHHEDSIRLVSAGVKYHARSIFAQGILISSSLEIQKRFPELIYFLNFQKKFGLSPLQSALSIFDSQSLFTSIIVGVSSAQELDQISNTSIRNNDYFFKAESFPDNLPISDPRKW